MQFQSNIEETISSLDTYQKRLIPNALKKALKTTARKGKRIYKDEYLKNFNLKDKKILDKALKAIFSSNFSNDDIEGYNAAVNVKAIPIFLSKFLPSFKARSYIQKRGIKNFGRNTSKLKKRNYPKNRKKANRKYKKGPYLSIKIMKSVKPIKLKVGFATFMSNHGNGNHFGIFKRKGAKRTPIKEYNGANTTVLENMRYKHATKPAYYKNMITKLSRTLEEEFLNNLEALRDL